MGKQDHFFAEVAKYKERFRNLPTDTIRQRLNDWADTLQKEAAIALRELLAEREQEPPPSAAKSYPRPLMRYRLRTLLIVLAVGPPVIAGSYYALREASAPTWAVALGFAQIVFWFVMLTLVLRGSLSRKSVPKPP